MVSVVCVCVCVQVDHLRTFIMFRFSMGFVDTLIAKCELNCVHQLVSMQQKLPSLSM